MLLRPHPHQRRERLYEDGRKGVREGGRGEGGGKEGRREGGRKVRGSG